MVRPNVDDELGTKVHHGTVAAYNGFPFSPFQPRAGGLLTAVRMTGRPRLDAVLHTVASVRPWGGGCVGGWGSSWAETGFPQTPVWMSLCRISAFQVERHSGRQSWHETIPNVGWLVSTVGLNQIARPVTYHTLEFPLCHRQSGLCVCVVCVASYSKPPRLSPH